MARGSSILVPVITIPLIISHFGNDRYGNFATLAAATGFLSILDFGYSTILHTKISKLNDEFEIQTFFSLVFFKQIKIVFIAAAILISFKVLDLRFHFLSKTFAVNFYEPLQAMLFGYFIYLIGNLNFKLLVATRKYFIASVIFFVASVLNLILTVIFCTSLKSFNALCFAAFGAQGLVLLIATPTFLRILPRSVRSGRARVLDLKSQLKISTLQVTWILGYQIDTIMVAQTIGFTSAGEYSIYQKLFFVPISMANFFYLPIWTNSASGFQNNNRRLLRKMILRASIISLLMLCISFIAIPILSAHTYQFDLAYFLAFNLYLILAIEAIPIVNSLNGGEEWSFALLSSLAGMVLNLLVGYVGLILFQWAPLAVIASSLALTFSLFIPYKIISSRRWSAC